MSIGKTFVRNLELCNGHCLNIHQLEVGDVGGNVWDAALVLLKYLETSTFWSNEKHAFEGKNVLELGAGTGAVGLAAASFGANVELTDLEELLPLLHHNVDENRKCLKGNVGVSRLKWGEDVAIKEKPSIVLVADCLYYEESLDPLLRTLEDVCDKDCTVLFSFEDRSEQGKEELQYAFFLKLETKFDYRQIPYLQLHPETRSPDIQMFEFRRKR